MKGSHALFPNDMRSYLPLFPLKLIVFPGELVNLHIFEERYRQLINECIKEDKPFGIPAYVKNVIEYGTEVVIDKLAKQYEDGTMDIITRATRIFKVASFDNPASEKLYAGGDVSFLENISDDTYSTKVKMIDLIKELYETINVVKSVEVSEDIVAFDIGHKIGLSLEEEYQLLQLEKESERQLFIIQHLQKAIPILQEVERTKEKIRMNGHFKHLDPLDF